MNQCSGILISGTHSGVGKTTASFALMALLSARGYAVSPYKVGPDFIDPQYHNVATGRASINLDRWLLTRKQLRESFLENLEGADIAVVEGMGALFDGQNGVKHSGSAADIATQLMLPVLLVVDAWGMTRSVGALLSGFLSFRPQANIVAVLLNKVGSHTHYEMIEEALPDRLKRLLIGYIPFSEELEVRERHLGLVTTKENAMLVKLKRTAIRLASKTVDLAKLVSCLGQIQWKRSIADRVPSRPTTQTKIAVAIDAAFCFYYEENLELLRNAGACLLPFSPIKDRRLPAGTSGIYLGGGYPEVFAKKLEANMGLRQQIKEAALHGMPVYGECGGLMYMGKEIIDFDGKAFQMAGIFPFSVRMDKRYLAIKYVSVKTLRPSILGPSSVVIRGQEFHQSRLVNSSRLPVAFCVTDSYGKAVYGGLTRGNSLASYYHLHFKSNPRVAQHFVNVCRNTNGN